MWPLAPGAWPGLSQSWPSFDVSLLVHDALLPNYGGAQRLTDARRKKPKNIILTQNEASAKRIRESFQFSEDSKKYEYVVCHNAEELLDAITDKEKASQHTIKGVFKPGIVNVALQNPSGAQLFTPPVSVPI
jgi:nicotinamidase-related amidase